MMALSFGIPFIYHRRLKYTISRKVGYPHRNSFQPVFLLLIFRLYKRNRQIIIKDIL